MSIIDRIEGWLDKLGQTSQLAADDGKCHCRRFGNCGAMAETDGYCNYCYTGKCGGARK